jgi:hypothetical protein
MSAEIHQFPASRRLENRRIASEQDKRNVLAEYLRTVATWIQRDDVECEPTALVLVLSGRTGDEVVWKGYEDNGEVSLKDAGRAANAQFNTPYKRRGGNFHDRRKP